MASTFKPLRSEHHGNKISLLLLAQPHAMVDAQAGNKILRVRLLLSWLSGASRSKSRSADAASKSSSIFRRIGKIDCFVICRDGLAQSSVYASFSIVHGVIPALLDNLPCAAADFGEAFRRHGDELQLFTQKALQCLANETNKAAVELIFVGRHFPGGAARVNVQPELISSSKSIVLWGKHRDVRGKYEEEGCAICLEEFDAEDVSMRLPCLHVFHGGCLLRSLRRSKSCPLCRVDLADFFPVCGERSVYVLS